MNFYEQGKIKLRPASKDDEDFVNKLNRQVMKCKVEGVWNSEIKREKYYSLNTFDQHLTKIIQYKGIDIGYLTIKESKNNITIKNIHLKPDFQGRGIGSFLIRQLLDKAVREGKTVELKVLENNPAKRLYERLGFKAYKESEHRFHMRFAK